MAMRIENFSEKGFDQGPVSSIAQFARIYPSWWNSNEPQGGHTLLKGGESKTKQTAAQLLQQAKHLGLQLPEQESSSTKSASQEMSFGGTVNSHNQSLSSESGQDESCGRSGEIENRPFFLFSNSEIVFNGSQADQTHCHPMVRASYLPVGDPYFDGLLIQTQGSQGAGIPTSRRVPLPLTFAEDGPIFVNPKQYNGILRRRQSRAKLEAQNKVVRTRKPYMHESRHRHALNRVRGSGGRFLSKQKLQEPDLYSG